MPRHVAKVDEFEEFVRQSYSGSLSSVCSSKTPPSGGEESPPSSPESVYPEDAEIMLGLSPRRRSPGSVRRRVSSDSDSAPGHLSEASLERHTRMFESRERMGRAPHPSYRVELSETRRSMTPSPRHRVLHAPLGISYSANSPLPVRANMACRPNKLDLLRSRKLDSFLDDCQKMAASGVEEETLCYRVRSFSTSSKGIINRGDSLRVRQGSASASACAERGMSPRLQRSRVSSLNSQGSSTSDCTDVLTSLPPVHKVLVIGASNVGKTSLTQQFMTSEYMGHMDSFDEHDTSVNVMLDSEEANLQFVTLSPDEDYLWCDDVDAYVIVYSVSDLASCQRAANILEDIRHDLSRQTAIILVANKADIVRNRVVSESDGKRLAKRYDCKYIAVSAVLNHKVDELLAGVVSQIRLTQKRNRKNRGFSDGYDQPWFIQKAARGITRVLRKNPWHFRSCDNLLVL